jgi:YggT family protein
VHIVAAVALYLLYTFLGLLLVRMVVSWVMAFARDWRPAGAAAAALELTFAATDPPLRALHRFLPPLRLGSVAFDVGFIVLFIATLVLIDVVRSYA